MPWLGNRSGFHGSTYLNSWIVDEWKKPGFIVEKNIWVNYNDLTATSLEIMVSKGNHPQMALIQGSEITIYPETWF